MSDANISTWSLALNLITSAGHFKVISKYTTDKGQYVLINWVSDIRGDPFLFGCTNKNLGTEYWLYFLIDS